MKYKYLSINIAAGMKMLLTCSDVPVKSKTDIEWTLIQKFSLTKHILSIFVTYYMYL